MIIFLSEKKEKIISQNYGFRKKESVIFPKSVFNFLLTILLIYVNWMVGVVVDVITRD